MNIKFTKMHGCGNDFMVIDNRTNSINLSNSQIIELADYKKSVGFDQLLLIENSKQADISIRIFNRDGSEINACGNGSRCVAKLILKELESSNITIATKERVLTAGLKDGLIFVNMGKAKIIQENMLFGDIKGSLVDIGNPHIIVNIDGGGWTNGQNLDSIDLAKYGSIIENDSRFPNKVNVNFVSIINRNLVKLRTWERGAGATLACGSGASTSFYLLYINGLIDSSSVIKQAGGNLNISIVNEEILMAGEAQISYRGIISN